MSKWYSWFLAALLLLFLILLIVSKFVLLIVAIVAIAAMFAVSLVINDESDRGNEEDTYGIKEEQSASQFINSLSSSNWYRIGDSLTEKKSTEGYKLAIGKDGKFNVNEVAQYCHDNYPGTLLAYMVDQKDNKTFLDSYNEFIDKVGPKEDSLKNVAVLHLRLGDKITEDKLGGSLKFKLPEVESLNALVFPFLKENNIRELRIICGLGAPKGNEKKENWSGSSIDYMEAVLKEAKKQKVKTVLVKGSPDEDLALLSKAPVVILTSGGYAMPSVAYRNKHFKTYVLINNPEKAKFFERYLQDSRGKVIDLRD